jgi:type IV secretion system protein VirD4
LAASFLDGCLHRAGREPFTPFRVSDMAGATTVHKESRTYTGNRLNPVLMHVMASEQESQRPLLTPDEAMRLPEDAALVFASGARPIFAAKLR